MSLEARNSREFVGSNFNLYKNLMCVADKVIICLQYSL